MTPEYIPAATEDRGSKNILWKAIPSSLGQQFYPE
jgi:hypothetical protein